MKVSKFPVNIKNNTNRIRFVGSVRFGPGEVKTISEAVYRRNQDKFEEGFLLALEDGTPHLSIVSDEDKKSYDKEAEAKEQEKQEKANRSVIRRYKEGELHWRQATSEIDMIEDLDTLIALREEAKALGVDPNSAVVRHIQMMIDGMQQLV